MCLYHAKKMLALTRLSNFTCIKQSRALMKSFIKSVCLLHFNPLTINVPYRIETSQLILNANQLTGFYMMGNTACYRVSMNISWLGRDVNNKIKNLYKYLLHLFYQYKNRFFFVGKLLKISFTAHRKYILSLTTELFKFQDDILNISTIDIFTSSETDL